MIGALPLHLTALPTQDGRLLETLIVGVFLCKAATSLPAVSQKKGSGITRNGYHNTRESSAPVRAYQRLCPGTCDDHKGGCAAVAGKAHRSGLSACDCQVGEVASVGSLGYRRSHVGDEHRN